MIFENGNLKSFGNEWSIYTKGNTVPLISREEAVANAIEAAKNYSLTFNVGPNGSYEEVPFTVNPDNVFIELHPVEREPLTLQLMWHSRVFFKEPVYWTCGIEVGQWADTGQIVVPW